MQVLFNGSPKHMFKYMDRKLTYAGWVYWFINSSLYDINAWKCSFRVYTHSLNDCLVKVIKHTVGSSMYRKFWGKEDEWSKLMKKGRNFGLPRKKLGYKKCGECTQIVRCAKILLIYNRDPLSCLNLSSYQSPLIHKCCLLLFQIPKKLQ